MTEYLDTDDPRLAQATVAARAAQETYTTTAYNHAVFVLGNLASRSTIPQDSMPKQLHAWEAEQTVDEAEASEALQQYVDFVIAPENKPAIEAQRELLAAFDRFAPQVTNLKNSLNQYAQPGDHPDFIAIGGSFRTYRLAADGQRYAVMIPRESQDTLSRVVLRTRDGLVVRGQDGFSQIAAVSYQEPAVVFELVEGRTLESLTATELAELPDASLDSLIETAVRAGSHGMYDLSVDNFVLETSSQRFVFVDLEITSNTTNRPDALMNVLVSEFVEFGRQQLSRYTTMRRPARQTRLALSRVLQRFGERCESRFGADELSRTLKRIQEALVEFAN